MWRWGRAVPLGPLLAGLGMMMSTSPGAVTSNLSQWLELFGLTNLPHWLVAKAADDWGRVILVIVMIVYCAIAWRSEARVIIRRVFFKEVQAQANTEASFSMQVIRAADRKDDVAKPDETA